MRVRNAVSPQEAKKFDTAQLREAFLIADLFKPGAVVMTYSHIDGIIIGSAVPQGKALELSAGKDIAAESFLERRELCLINIGAAGAVSVDGQELLLEARDGLYIGRGAKDIKLTSADKSNPAKFYFLSAPAHAGYPTKKVSLAEAKQVHLGDRKSSNLRTIHQYVHPDVLESCQLVVRNQQAVISPSWSIHSGVGTTNYSFIWGMVGENQAFTDMDHVSMDTLK
jgi:4-deoxy-L-threo-5-hexosulose-uronate ketol-isomerase